MILILILMNYTATSTCLALLQQSRACAAYNYLVLATKVLKLSTLFTCTTLSYITFALGFIEGRQALPVSVQSGVNVPSSRHILLLPSFL